MTPITGLMTTEAGGTATFTVVLTSAPTGDVTINLSSSDTDRGHGRPASLTFTAANWNVAQTVTVTGVDDALVDGDVAYTIATTVTSGDAIYAAHQPRRRRRHQHRQRRRGHHRHADLRPGDHRGRRHGDLHGGADDRADRRRDDHPELERPHRGHGRRRASPSPPPTGTWRRRSPSPASTTALDDGDVAYTIATTVTERRPASTPAINPADVAVTNTDNDAAAITVTPTIGPDDDREPAARRPSRSC